MNKFLVLTLSMVSGFLPAFLIHAADMLPSFAYHEIKLQFVDLQGKPVPGASVYGFCRELNLLWPRRDTQWQGPDDVIWHESLLGKTDATGTLTAIAPPGKWKFFALGHSNDAKGTVVTAWTDAREWPVEETIHLAPTVIKQWSLCSQDSTVLAPNRIFLRPLGFPVWIPADLGKPSVPLQIETTAGDFQLWATRDADGDQPGFVIDWGTVSVKQTDGKIMAGKTTSVKCKGGQGQASLSWSRWENFGLEGAIKLGDTATVDVTPGIFSIAYQRPIGNGLTGRFVGQFYTLSEGQSMSLDLTSPLTAGLDHGLSKPNVTGKSKLVAQLYIVDANGHVLSKLENASQNPINFDATVMIDGQRLPAHPMVRDAKVPELDESGQMMFSVEVRAIPSNAIWDLTGPPGALANLHLAQGERVTVTSESFKMEVPKIIEQDARNVLAQADLLAEVMKQVSGRTRQVGVTDITAKPGGGASASHNGVGIHIGTKLFFRDRPMSPHDIVHELGHNFGFTHGGLHETVVEVSRCAGGDQISQQPAKWMFLDRMNGMPTREAPPRYPNKGLYLYCYAQGGPAFLQFMSVKEYPAIDKLGAQGFSKDEVTAALLSVALGRDLTPICKFYGLNITPERMALAIPAVRAFCQTP